MNIQDIFNNFEITIYTKTLFIKINKGDKILEYINYFIKNGTEYNNILILIKNITMYDDNPNNILKIRRSISELIQKNYKNEDYSILERLIIKRTIQKNYMLTNNIPGKYKFIIGETEHFKYKELSWNQKNYILNQDIYFGQPNFNIFAIDKAFSNLKINGIIVLDYDINTDTKTYAKLFRKKYVNNILGFNVINKDVNVYFTNQKKYINNMIINNEKFSFKTEEEYTRFIENKFYINEKYIMVSNNKFYRNEFFPINKISKQGILPLF